MFNLVRPAALVAITIFAISYATHAQTAVGLYDPDLTALRKMIGPDGKPISFAGEDHQKFIASWNNLSAAGRELLLKQRDLAVVVVNNTGQWAYRSSGIPRLVGLNPPLRKDDFADILQMLDDPKVQTMRNFYYDRRFGNKPTSETYGSFLEKSKEQSTSAAETAWFNGFVGAEIQALDAETQSRLFADEEYGPALRAAAAQSNRTRNDHLHFIAGAYVNPLREQIAFDDLALALPENAGDVVLIGHEKGFAGHREVFSWTADGNTVYVVPTNDRAGAEIKFTRTNIFDLLREGKARVFVASAVQQKVFGLSVPN